MDAAFRALPTGVPPGPYQLQAAIAACHAQAPRPDGHRLARDRGPLRRARGDAPGPVVELNRAVAVAMADGPAAGLALVEALGADGASTATTCSMPRAPTCSGAWAGAARPRQPTSARSSWPRTRPSARSSPAASHDRRLTGVRPAGDAHPAAPAPNSSRAASAEKAPRTSVPSARRPAEGADRQSRASSTRSPRAHQPAPRRPAARSRRRHRP